MKKLIVLKIGTKSIVASNGLIRKKLLDKIAEDVAFMVKRGYHTIIVSSGAIACGKIIAKKGLSKQAYAGIGQPHLMACWEKSFKKAGLIVAQGLYVNNDLRRKANRQSATKTLNEYRRAGIIPILNENDLITDAEIKDLHGFGDNDQLASLIAIAKKAKFLFLLTTVNGVICSKTNTIVPHLSPYEKQIENSLQMKKGDSNGGMISKVHSAKALIRLIKGSRAFIISYREENSLRRIIIENEKIGTEIS